MANCKACGAWFSSTAQDEICPTCGRALKRLNGYAVTVIRCKNCARWQAHCNGKAGMCAKRNGIAMPDDFCSYGERRSE